jgi:hypothetical protein
MRTKTEAYASAGKPQRQGKRKAAPFRGRHLTISLLASVAVLACLALSVAPASAKRTHLFQEPFGSAAQPTFRPKSIALDRSSGDLLVVDSKEQTVSRFHADGTPADFSALGTNVIDAKGNGNCATVPADCDQTPQDGFLFTSGAGEEQIAVDSTATDGNIYVTQGPQAAGNLVDIFAGSGRYLGQLTAAGATKFGTAGSFPFSPCGVTVDGAGNVYLGGGYDKKIYKFDPSANPPVNADNTATFNLDEPICSLAAGAGPTAGSLFVNFFNTFDGNSVLKLDSASGALQSIADPGISRGVSVDPVSGHLYSMGASEVSNGALDDYVVREFDASGSSASLVSTTPVEAGGAGITGLAVDGPKLYLSVPSGGGQMNPLFVYGPTVTVPDTTTGTATITGDTSVTVNGTVNPDGVALEECAFEYGPSDTYGQIAPCAESPAEIGTSQKTVHANLSSLDPEALYHFRLIARNVNDTTRGSDQTFRTPGKPAIVGLWSKEVGYGEATLQARINPESSATTYRFEYGADSSYGNSTAQIAIGSDNTDHLVSLVLGGLDPGITYHYRLVAINGIGTSEAADHTFTTYPSALAVKTDCPNQVFRTGPSALLPDCRAFEMVSPVDKNGGDIKVLNITGGAPSRLDQSAVDGGRFAYSSVASFAGATSSPWTSQYLATRHAGEGWSTQPISPPRQSKSLDDGINVKFDVQFKAFAPDLAAGWLVQDTDPALEPCAPENTINLYRRDNVSGGYEALTTAKPPIKGPTYSPELQGVSADGTHTIFRADGKLTADASNAKGGSGGPIYQLYEHIQGEGCGELRLVSVLPNGSASSFPASAGTPSGAPPAETRLNTVARAMSADGSRIFWSAVDGSLIGKLYVRVNGNETVQISDVLARFWTAASDGSVAIYSVGEDLFEFDVDKALAGENGATHIAAGFKGVAGASEDASRLYFVSTEELNGEGEAGEPNLYLRRAGGATSLVATLFGSDATLPGGDVEGGFEYAGFNVGRPEPIANGVRVTPDGAHLAFASAGSPTGYDNKDAVDGLPDLEIYLYDIASGKVACVSCNPSGARPAGRQFKEGDSIRRVSAQMPPGENQTFAPRVLSDDGDSLFFESLEALLPRDTNGKADVYEWQRASSQAQCVEAGAELYVPASGGCLSLISTGQSPGDSEIADATPDGSNVFIRTASSLLPQDPGQIDVYDARVNGGMPQPPAQPAACEGEACQGPFSPPNDVTPASSTFHGAGNVKAPVSCKKGQVKKKGRCVKQKKHAAKKHKQGRKANDSRRAGR